MSSWGEECNMYIKEKSFSPPKLVPVEHITRDKSMAWRQQQRSFNPVLGVMVDSSTEAARQTKERIESKQMVDRGVEKALASTQHAYDIVNNKPRYNLSETDIARLGGNQETHGKKSEKNRPPFVNYNILTNEVVPKWSHITEPPERHKGMPAIKKGERDCNIVSNVFKQNDREKKEAERQKILEHGIAQVSTKLNPVLGRYYSAEVEQKETSKKQSEESKLRKAVLQDRTFPVPAPVAKTEGSSYDIIRNEVFKPSGVTRIDMTERVPVAAKAVQR
eukprot:PhF_6_TR34982/c0_g1_i2/m.50822